VGEARQRQQHGFRRAMFPIFGRCGRRETLSGSVSPRRSQPTLPPTLPRRGPHHPSEPSGKLERYHGAATFCDGINSASVPAAETPRLRSQTATAHQAWELAWISSDHPEPEAESSSGQQHPPRGTGRWLVISSEVNGVFAGALQKILGAIERIEFQKHSHRSAAGAAHCGRFLTQQVQGQ